MEINKLPLTFGALSVSPVFWNSSTKSARCVNSNMLAAHMAFAQFNEPKMTVFATQIQPQLMSRQR